MNYPKPLSALNKALSAGLQGLLVVVFVLLVLDVLFGVFSRHVLSDQAAWSEELARFLMVWLALFGAALACREQSHLGLDAVVRTWPTEVRRLSNVVVQLLVLVFAVWIMLWGGGQLFADRMASGQTLPALGIAKAWFYLAIPISGALITSFTLEQLWIDWFASEKQEEGGEA